jgi:peptidoglycan-associated lipoprotein
MGRQNIGQTRTRSAATPASTKPGERSSLQALRQGEKPVTSASNPLKEIYFDYDRYDVRGDARETLRANAAWLKSNPAVPVQIEGHADERGTSEYNLALGARRAQSAKDYLVTLGITEARVTTISYGEEVPVCKEGGESCWQKNRRARFVPTAPVPGS